MNPAPAFATCNRLSGLPHTNQNRDCRNSPHQAATSARGCRSAEASTRWHRACDPTCQIVWPGASRNQLAGAGCKPPQRLESKAPVVSVASLRDVQFVVRWVPPHVRSGNHNLTHSLASMLYKGLPGICLIHSTAAGVVLPRQHDAPAAGQEYEVEHPGGFAVQRVS